MARRELRVTHWSQRHAQAELALSDRILRHRLQALMTGTDIWKSRINDKLMTGPFWALNWSNTVRNSEYMFIEAYIHNTTFQIPIWMPQRRDFLYQLSNSPNLSITWGYIAWRQFGISRLVGRQAVKQALEFGLSIKCTWPWVLIGSDYIVL